MQFLGNASMASWMNKMNHEIDIEIPANCMGTAVCRPTAEECSPSHGLTAMCNTTAREAYGCINDFNTANLNNYILTTNGGSGFGYSNMCVATHEKIAAPEKRKPFMLIGDGKFHKYSIDWHTGGPGVQGGARVDFYVDDVLIGTNNVFVPTRGSRFVISHWAPEQTAASDPGDSVNPKWANFPDNWGGEPGDGLFYLSHTYISEIKITPHNEPNDIMYPDTYDRPDGCTVMWGQEQNGCHPHWNKPEWELMQGPPSPDLPQPGVLGTCA
eukprot:g122.t1